MKQPVRPAQIATIMKTIGSQYPANVGTTLEAYIFYLEARQLPVLPNGDYASSHNPDNPPRWSHARVVERENRRRKRALRRQNNFQ